MITSLDNKKVKDWGKLHIKKYRKDAYLLLSEDLVNKAKEANYLKILIYVGNCPFEFIDSYEVSQEVMDKISKQDGLRYIGVASFIKECDDYRQRVLILDDLQDPLNIGRIIESAYLFGFDSIILSPNSADIYHEKALEASKGDLYKINIKRCELIGEINKLKENGFKIYATGLKKKTISLSDAKTSEKLAIVMGNEGSGVSEDIFEISYEIIKIDMANIDSLNVAMAAAIVMYHFSV